MKDWRLEEYGYTRFLSFGVGYLGRDVVIGVA
jgi:hypothetical protein